MMYVYILRSNANGDQCYVGVTRNLNDRLNTHNRGESIYTAKCRPWILVYAELVENDVDAFRRERQIKKWSRAKKEALIVGNKAELKRLAKRRVY